MGSILPKLVGEWKGDLYERTTYKFHADGTYETEHYEELYRTDRGVTIRSKGSWTATEDWIEFTAKEVTADGIRTTQQVFDEHKRWATGIPRRMPVKWTDSNTWQPTEVGIGHFVRQK